MGAFFTLHTRPNEFELGGTKHFAAYCTRAQNVLEIDILGYETFSTFYNNRGAKHFSEKLLCMKHIHNFVKCETFLPPLPIGFNFQISIARLKSLADKKKQQKTPWVLQ